MKSQFVITREREDYSYMSISGEIDVSSVENFKNILDYIIGVTCCNLKIDCSKLNYIDSTGLNVLVKAMKKMKLQNRTIQLHNLRKHIQNLFQVTGLESLFVRQSA